MELRLVQDAERNAEWLNVVTNNLNVFIQDHADCERRASATALGIIAKYPDKHKINKELISLSIKKLERFQELYNYMAQHHIPLPREMAFDLYGKQLGWLIKSSKDERLLDRLLIAGIVEAREQERIYLLHLNLNDKQLKEFYGKFIVHGNIFIDLCAEFFPPDNISSRMEELCTKEAEIISNLELRAALH